MAVSVYVLAYNQTERKKHRSSVIHVFNVQVQAESQVFYLIVKSHVIKTETVIDWCLGKH